MALPRLPDLRESLNACESPHVVLLGAGASRAAFPHGDRNGRALPLMDDLVDVLDLRSRLEALDIDTSDNFEATYCSIVERGSELEDLRRDLEEETRRYFTRLDLPDEVCLYDELLVTLRAKDLVASFNWDPLLLQAYARNAGSVPMPRIVFLHGNVAVGVCRTCRVKGWTGAKCGQCGSDFESSPLLFPIADKDYTANPFISAEWEEFRWFIGEAYLFTIFGYRAPTTDTAAKDAMLEVWLANQSRDLAEILIIDIEEESILEERWSEFFVRSHYGISATSDRSWQFRHPRRSCDAFAMATLQLRPCRENPIPRFKSLADLHTWLVPVVEEERAMYEDGNPLSC